MIDDLAKRKKMIDDLPTARKAAPCRASSSAPKPKAAPKAAPKAEPQLEPQLEPEVRPDEVRPEPVEAPRRYAHAGEAVGLRPADGGR